MNLFRKTNISAVLPLALLIGACVVGGITACNTTQQRIAANTLSATHDVVAAGVDSYYDATVTGLASKNGIAPVGAAYDKFQKVYVSAVIFARNNTNALAPDNVIQEASSVAAAIGQFYEPAAKKIKTSLKIP
jgi:hypothetical protein